jgi:WD40 repeat protein
MGALSGLVEFTTLRPVDGAAVTIQGPSGTIDGATDIAGIFFFSGLLPGTYSCRITVPSTREGSQTVVLDTRTPAPPGAPTALFTAVGSIQGTVTLAGAPSSAGVEVSAIIPGSPNPLTTTTSGDGSFALTAIPVGSAVVSVTMAGFYQPPVSTIFVPYDAAALLPPLTLQPTTPGGGQVRLLGLADASGTVITVVERPFQTTADADGLFSLSVPPGQYTLQIENEAHFDLVPNVLVTAGLPLQTAPGGQPMLLPVLPIPRAQRIFDSQSNYLANAGSEPPLIAAPDGAHLLWSDLQNDLWLIPTLGGQPVELLQNGMSDLPLRTAQFSPDGSELLYETSLPETGTTLTEYATATGSARSVTSTAGQFLWSPQGAFAYFEGNRMDPTVGQLVVWESDRANVIVPAPFADQAFSFVPDGSTVLYTDNTALGVAPVVVGATSTLISGPSDVANWTAARNAHVALFAGFDSSLGWLDWDARASVVLGQAAALNPGGPPQAAFRMLDAKGNPLPWDYGSIASDGSRVAWLSAGDDVSGQTVAPAFTDRNTGTTVTGPSILPPLQGLFGPDADQTLLIADDGTLQRWTLSGGEVQTTELAFKTQYFVPSPDWSRLAFVTAPDAGGASTLAVIPVQGGASTTLFSGALSLRNGWIPVLWSPDGAHLAFATDDGTVLIASAAGGTAVPVLDAAQGTTPAWLDNQRLAAAIQEEQSLYAYRLGIYVASVP